MINKYNIKNNLRKLYKMSFYLFNIFISLIFFIYYGFIQKYILSIFINKKYNSKYYLVYWIDYNIMIFSLTIISIHSSINFLINNNIFENSAFLVILDKNFPFLFLSNLFVDIILSIQLLIKIKNMKISKKKVNDIQSMIEFIKKINIFSHYTLLSHLIIILIANIVNVIIAYMSIYIIENNNKTLFVNISQIILFSISIIFILILSSKNKTLIQHQIFFKNSLVEKIYNNNKKKLIACAEHLLYKYICDLLLNIPCLINIFYNSSTDIYKISYLYSIMFAGFIYIFFLGTMLLSIDSHSFNLLPCVLKFLFCTKHFSFYFGDGKNIITKPLELDNSDIFNYDIYFNKSKLFNSQEDFINKLNGIRGYSETTLSSLFEENELINNNFEDNNNFNINQTLSQSKIDEQIREIENKKIKKEYVYGPCNFFIIFKLLYLFYNSNIKIYEKISKSTEEKGIFYDNNNSNKNKSAQKNYGRFSNGINYTNQRILSMTKIKQRINSINKEQPNQILALKKYNIKEVFGNIEDHAMKTLFIKYLSKNLEIKKNDNQKTNDLEFGNKIKIPEEIRENSEIYNLFFSYSRVKNIPLIQNSINNDDDINSFYEFKIESLINNIFLDLFPYYEIDIRDILISLDTSNNKNLFETFYIKKADDKNFNSYYTYDSFLSLEIYDDKILPHEELKSFMEKYKNYFLDKITNFGFTCLPIILGIFNISYLSYNKIVILLRNPLAFTQSISFRYWLKYIYNEDSERTENSSNKDDIVNINELEIMNNIKISKDDYSDIITILNEDMKFLSQLKKNLDFNLNLFILNSINKHIGISFEDNIMNDTNKNNNNTTENSNLMNIIRNTEFFPGNNSFEIYNFKKKFFGSNSISLLENLYMSSSSNNNYFFKIYISEIFKNNNEFKSKENINNNHMNSLISESKSEKEIIENNKNICQIIKNKLLKKLQNPENIFFEE